MQNLKLFLSVLLINLVIIGCTKPVPEDINQKTGNVIFLHPDGSGLTTWHANRILNYGPDGESNWDRMPHTGLYRSHILNSLTTSSNAGATIHAYGVKADYGAFGLINGKEITAASGKNRSIMQEAMDAGMKTGLINSGNIIEPGTAVFVSSREKRSMYEDIAKDVAQSGVDVILSGGEEWLLPEGVEGRYGLGKRTDGLNLISWLQDNGYTIVYTKDELSQVPQSTEKLFGVFAENHTFNAKEEEILAEKNLPLYWDYSPSLDQMMEKTIEILSYGDKKFFLVVEEEATDNFANNNNAAGVMEAVKRSDLSIGVVQKFMKKNPNTLLIVAADSEAGGLDMIGNDYIDYKDGDLTPETDRNGAPVDGQFGAVSKPYFSKPDRNGNILPFHFVWNSYDDCYGAVIVKAEGLNEEMVSGSFDNTKIYRAMYKTLFGINIR